MRPIAPLLLLALAAACAPSGPGLKPDAWFASQDPTASRRPLDCSDLSASTSAGRVGDPVVPARGAAVHRPDELGVGDVRLVWTSTVSNVPLDWVAPVAPGAHALWALRRADAGRCVVGTWSSPGPGMEVVKHAFTARNTVEVILLGLGPPPRRGWMVLVTDGSAFWSGLDSRNGRPGALIGEELEFREESDRLRLVLQDGGRSAVLEFDGVRFGPRP